MRIASDLLEQIIEHARRDVSEECCGYVSMRDGVAVAVHETENVLHSKRAFEVSGPDRAHMLFGLEDEGLELGAIYHSHLMSEPEPSQTDLNFGANWPGVEWIIVGLAGDEPKIRSWLIDKDDYSEVELVVE